MYVNSSRKLYSRKIKKFLGKDEIASAYFVSLAMTKGEDYVKKSFNGSASATKGQAYEHIKETPRTLLLFLIDFCQISEAINIIFIFML